MPGRYTAFDETIKVFLDWLEFILTRDHLDIAMLIYGVIDSLDHCAEQKMTLEQKMRKQQYRDLRM